MATLGWRSGHSLKEQWQAQHAGFDYYQLVSLLLRDQSRAGAGVERRVRFCGDLSAAFPGHEVSGLEQGADGAITVSSANYSVAGPIGPLPDPYADWARERSARGDHAMADFLDLFNDRLHALRFAIKSRFRPSLNGTAPEESDLGAQLEAILGLSDTHGDPLPVPRRSMLALAGLLTDRRRSAAAITSVLSAYLDAPVAIEQMVGAWQPIPKESRTRLGRRNSRLGVNAVLGARVWDQQARIGIAVGALSAERFAALLPGGDGHEDFVALVRFLTDRGVDVEVRLHTAARGLRLGREETRLGLQSWLGEGAREGESRFVIRAFGGQEEA